MADDLLVSAQIDPNTPGNRFLVVRVDDTRRPAPGVVSAVEAVVGDGDVASLVRGKDGLWTTSTSITEPGLTSFQVTAHRAGLPDAVATLSWTVAPVPGTQIGGSPLNRYVAVAIAGLIVTWLLVLLVEGVVRPRRRAQDGDVHDDVDTDEQEPGAGYDVAVDEDLAAV
jgi:copper transport protein